MQHMQQTDVQGPIVDAQLGKLARKYSDPLRFLQAVGHIDLYLPEMEMYAAMEVLNRVMKWDADEDKGGRAMAEGAGMG